MIAGILVAIGVFVLLLAARWPLGTLNFVVLQWFGVRLARRYKRVLVNETPIALYVDFRRGSMSLEGRTKVERRPDGWQLLRWVWPLTGWRSEFRWIARRP